MYWTNFWQPTVHVQQNIFEKLFKKLVSNIFTLLLTPFAFKLVNYSRHSARGESLNIRKNSKIDDIFLRRQLIVNFQTYFKDSLCLQILTNFGVKCAQRSVKMWTTSFYWSFSKNILFYMSSRLSKIRSVHTYVMPRTVYFGWICSWRQSSRAQWSKL